MMYKSKTSENMRKQANKSPPKIHSSLTDKLTDMEVNEIAEEDYLKLIYIKKFSELKEDLRNK